MIKKGLILSLKDGDRIFIEMSVKAAKSTIRSKYFNIRFTGSNGKLYNISKKDVEKMEIQK